LTSVHHPLSHISILPNPTASATPGSPEGGKSRKTTHELLEEPLQQWNKVVFGNLSNGLQYVLLPNNTPQGRVEAYLQVF